MVCKSNLSVNHLHLHVQILLHLHLCYYNVYLFFTLTRPHVNVLGRVNISVNTKIICKKSNPIFGPPFTPKPFLQGYL
jgi:hypothetical protein